MRFPTRGRGFALAYFLLFSLVLVMFVTALFALGQQGLRTTRSGVDGARALYAAEAGLARAMSILERDPSWTEGFDDEPLPGGGGTYSAQFATSPDAATPMDCLSNLQGNGRVDTYHGPLSLPARSALLVVSGSSGSATRTVEAVVVTGLDISSTDALTATGPIHLAGEVSVDGRKSLIDPASRPANLHHNSTDSNAAAITYSGSGDPDDSISVSGEVTSSSNDPPSSLFVFSNSGPTPSTRAGVPLKELPRPNITAMLDEHVTLGAVSIPPTPGPFSISGDNYYGGDVSINGDLKLRHGARVYVRGNLLVNGSVSGKGTLIVGGRSEFYGDADVSGQQSEYIALLSRGSVTLKGFSGEAYMRALTAGNPSEAQRWKDLKYGLKVVNELLAPYADLPATTFAAQLLATDSPVDNHQALIGEHPYGVAMGPLHRPDGTLREWSNANHFRDLVGSGSPTQNFLHARFQTLDDWFRQCNTTRNGVVVVPPHLEGIILLSRYSDWDPAHDGGIFDSLESVHQHSWIAPGGGTIPGHPFSPQEEKSFLDAMAAAQEFDYNRLGNASFKGLIYTSGAFVGRDDVTVLGTVIVNGDSTLPPLVDGGVTYQPGEVGLYGHTHLTRVDEFFDDGVENLLGSGTLDIKRWVNR